MKQRLALQEHRKATAVPLSGQQVAALQSLGADLTIEPSGHDRFDVTPGSKVGVLRAGDLVVEINPKLPIERLLFLISYSLDPRNWHSYTEHFSVQSNVVEAITPGFLWQAESALSQGLQHGYVEVEEAGLRVRGRPRFVEQVRKHHGRVLPLEIRHDDFTPDIELNRLVRAGLHCVERLPRRSDVFSPRLRRLRAALEPVALVRYDRSKLPSPIFSRLNERYRAAVHLSRLLIQCTSFDMGLGSVPASGFLVDMNTVFENFVLIALREELKAAPQVLVQGASIWLDEGRQVELRPDVSWWDGAHCTFVGDVKYKRSQARGGANSDLYQLLAYLSATGLEHGLLIYAAGHEVPRQHVVHMAGKTLEVATVDCSGSPEHVLASIRKVAHRVRALRKADFFHIE